MGTTGTETHFLTEKEVEELAMAQQRQEEVWCVCVTVAIVRMSVTMATVCISVTMATVCVTVIHGNCYNV